jgi:hypothetical protein
MTISPSKSQAEIQQKKKKINVTASSIKMKTEAAEPNHEKPISSVQAFTDKKGLKCTNQN